MKRKSINNIFRGNKLLLIAAGLLFFCLTALLNVVFANSTDSAPLSFWLWTFLGRLHPLMVHFPLGLLIFAAILELFTLRNFNSSMRPGINLLILAGVATSALSVSFGLLLSEDGDYGEELLFLHQWIGIATCLLAIGTWLRLRAAVKDNSLLIIKSYRVLLFLTAIGVSVAGHYGASLTHGKDYLSSTLPWMRCHFGFNGACVNSEHSKVFYIRETLVKHLTLTGESLQQKLNRFKGIV